jgi:hypothetical protein
MASTRRQEFTRKPHGGKFIYTWKPETEITKKGKKVKTVETGCSATAGSQGIDNDVTYVYEKINTSGVISRIAYVACDYVE